MGERARLFVYSIGGLTSFTSCTESMCLFSVIGTGLNFESQLGCVRMTDKHSGEEKIIDILLEPSDIHLPLTDPLSKVTQGIFID